MRQSDYYKLDLVEGEDIVNPLAQDVPNYEKIDKALHDNYLAGISKAEEVKVGTVHQITRENKDLNIFVLQTVSDYKTGDTFTVDENKVTAYLPNGNALTTGAFKTNSQLICVLYLNALYICTVNDDSNLQEQINNINNQINDINIKIENINERQIIVIGDSYGTANGGGVTVNPYPELLKTKTGLNDNLIYYTRNGTGFGNNGFLNNLKAISVADKSKILDIYVLGGWNDSADKITDSNTVTENMVAFSTYAKATYPNAKLHLGFLAYGNTTSTSLMNLIQPYTIYKNCQNYGFDSYIKNCESICANRQSKWWVSKSGQGLVHPSQNLEERIANYLCGYIINNSLSFADSSTLTLTGIDTITTMSPNVIVQRVIDNTIYTEFNQRVNVQTSSPFNLTSNTYKALFNITNNIVVGLTNNLNGIALASLYINSAWTTQPIFWKIQNNQFLISSGQQGITNISGMYISCATVTNNIIEN